MKAYDIRYALTKGVRIIDCEPTNDPGVIRFPWKNDTVSYEYCYLNPYEWAATKEKATEKVEAKRKRKVISLQKQLKRLENWKVTIPDLPTDVEPILTEQAAPIEVEQSKEHVDVERPH